MCFARVVDGQGRIHSADFVEGSEGEEEETILSRWDKENPGKERISWIPRKRLSQYYFVVEFILKEA